MSDWQIDNITLPGDLRWPDRHWSPTKQAEDLSLGGGVIVQKSDQTAGRPITLETSRNVLVYHEDVVALEQFRDDPATDVFTVTAPDGTEYQCRFRFSQGNPVDASPLFPRNTHETGDPYNLTLRLIVV
ncbi:MAG: hypothetical protein ACOCSR_01260 [Wenzhouxiangella sp.]